MDAYFQATEVSSSALASAQSATLGYVVHALSNAPSLSLTQAQDGYWGRVGDGYLVTESTGHRQAIGKNIDRLHTEPIPDNGLEGVRQHVHGKCAPERQWAECQAENLEPGSNWRADLLLSHNQVLQMREAYARCQARGYAGADLQRCAASLAAKPAASN